MEAEKTTIKLSVDFRVVSAVLLAVILVMTFLWQPWRGLSGTSDRTVRVTGTATIKAEPNEYLFMPTYEFKNAKKSVGLAAMTAKNNEVVAGLKKLGVEDKDIKNNSNNYQTYSYPGKPETDEQVYHLSLTVTVATKEMAQKVEDYLLTTEPSGQVTPMGQFSDVKKKELEDQARSQASQDAKAKADKSAKDLGYRLGRVKSVEDGQGFGGPITLEGRSVAVDSAGASLAIQPGQEEIVYTVTVTYYVR